MKDGESLKRERIICVNAFEAKWGDKGRYGGVEEEEKIGYERGEEGWRGEYLIIKTLLVSVYTARVPTS